MTDTTNTLTWMLGREDRAILDFEQGWWTRPGPKDQTIEFSLGLPAAHYYERLLALIGDPEAMADYPLTVKRVMRVIEPTSTVEVAV